MNKQTNRYKTKYIYVVIKVIKNTKNGMSTKYKIVKGKKKEQILNLSRDKETEGVYGVTLNDTHVTNVFFFFAYRHGNFSVTHVLIVFF